jgi:micrococcal nuclease
MIHDAKIINVVDGDTFDAIVDLDFALTLKIRIRLFGVDCPEMSKKNPAGIAAKEFSQMMLLDQKIVLNYIKHDSFGRCLCQLYLIGKNYADILLEAGHAAIYRA